MKKRLGQSATEYAMIAAFAMMVILPATYFFYSYSHSTEKRIEEAQLNKLAKDIAVNAEKVYYLGGYPSLVTLEEQFPAGIKYIDIQRNWSGKRSEINFWVSTENGIYERSYPANVNLMGFFGDTSVTPGTRKVKIAASYNRTGAPYVLVSIDSDCFISTTYDLDGNGNYDIPADLAVCTPCIGQSASGACEKCDFNGNCFVDNADLVMWQILANGNSPPKASISGASIISFGSSGSFSYSGNDIDDNLAGNVRIYYTPTSSNSPSLIPGCPSPCSWTPPAKGSYYVFVEATDTQLFKCSGNTFGFSDGTADCGYDDNVMVSVI